eukprot:1186574-Prorocentrum_minimum.AAC.4
MGGRDTNNYAGSCTERRRVLRSLHRALASTDEMKPRLVDTANEDFHRTMSPYLHRVYTVITVRSPHFAPYAHRICRIFHRINQRWTKPRGLGPNGGPKAARELSGRHVSTLRRDGCTDGRNRMLYNVPRCAW